MLQNVVRNAPRTLRSHLHRGLDKTHKLFLLSPKQAGDKLWRFAALHEGTTVLLGKGVVSRDVGRAVAINRFGVKATELKAKKDKKVLAEAA